MSSGRTCAWSVAFLLSACGSSNEPAPSSAPDHATIPLLIEGNRPYVELTLTGPAGATRTGRFLVDTGGGGFLLSQTVATDLGVSWGETKKEEGMEFAGANVPPSVKARDFALTIDPARVIVIVGAKKSVLPPAVPGYADGVLPGHVLAKHHVVFDYPGATFTIGRPGSLVPKGDPLPMPVGKRSGFPRTEIEVDGVPRGFLVDTGASFTMVSDALLKSLGEAHPTWERHQGPHGDAKTLGGQAIETLYVPTAKWGTRTLTNVGVVSQREGTFERYMSSMMAAPIVGALAGNVLTAYRVEFDFAKERLYLSTP